MEVDYVGGSWLFVEGRLSLSPKDIVDRREAPTGQVVDLKGDRKSITYLPEVILLGTGALPQVTWEP